MSEKTPEQMDNFELVAKYKFACHYRSACEIQNREVEETRGAVDWEHKLEHEVLRRLELNPTVRDAPSVLNPAPAV